MGKLGQYRHLTNPFVADKKPTLSQIAFASSLAARQDHLKAWMHWISNQVLAAA
jgi:hypothetical protein